MKTIYHNAKVYTGEKGFAEAFIVEDGQFGAVGSEEEILALGCSGTEYVDLKGSFVCAGFNDSHMHLLGYGEALGAAALGEHTESLEGMLKYLKEYLRDNPVREGGWLLGRGWNQDLFKDTDSMPSRKDLDWVSADIPIMITRTCGHCCVLNSKALEICGIDKNTVSPEGGSIGREDGEPDGRLFDNAMDLAETRVPLPGKDEIKDMIRRACRALNSYGVSSVQSDDYCAFRAVPFETVNEAYRELEESGELTVRVYEQANFTSLEELKAFAEAGNLTGKGSDFFRIGPLKMLGDGSLGSRTAYLSRPYADDPNTRGLLIFTPEEMKEMISYANRIGMQVAVHAIGDACLDLVLDCVEEALKEHPREDHRHGVVHCQISRPDQLERIGRLRMHVYAQSVFLDYDNHIAEKRVGKELASSSYSWKTLMKKGVCVSNGSDCPVELPDVMKGIECAVTRTSLDGTGPYLPEEAFTLSEALDSYTVKGARASFEEGRKGKIAPGYLADFTVLRKDPFETEERKLHEIEVLACFLGGKKVYAGEGYDAVTIREIKKEDDRAVEELIRGCLKEFGADHEGTAWMDPDLGRFSEIYTGEGNMYWVAEDEDGSILAGAGIGRLPGAGGVCELQKMYSLPKARGRGIAHRLMETALRYAKKYYKSCYLETLDNMTAAQRFYEKHGFERTFEDVADTGHFACDVRYIKEL